MPDADTVINHQISTQPKIFTLNVSKVSSLLVRVPIRL